METPMPTPAAPSRFAITVTVNPVDPQACTRAALDDDAYYLDLYNNPADETA